MSDDAAAFASFEEKWLAAHPEQRMVALFLDPTLRLRASAFGCLAHEIEEAAFGISDTQVAAAKLNWWQQELFNAAAGHPRHPITQLLFSEADVAAIPARDWRALIDGALEQLDVAGPASLDDLIARLDPFFSAAANLESKLLCGGRANPESDAALWTLAHLLHALARPQPDANLLPLDLCARHGLTRAQFAQPAPERDALIRDFLGDIEREIAGALGIASARPLGLSVRARLDRKLVARARAARDPLRYLAQHAHPHAWSSLWAAWREARRAVS
jgi:phytoene synthase